MKNIRALTAIVLSLCLTMLLAACAGSGAAETTGASAETTEPSYTFSTDAFSTDAFAEPGMDGNFDDYGMEDNYVEEDPDENAEIVDSITELPDEIVTDPIEEELLTDETTSPAA